MPKQLKHNSQFDNPLNPSQTYDLICKGRPPEEWETVTIGKLIDRNVIYKPVDGNHGDLHPTSEEYVSEGIPFVLATDVVNDKINLQTCKFLKKERADQLRKGFAREGDILLTHKGSVGNTAVVPEISSEYIMLTPQVTYYRIKDKNILNNYYLKCYFQSPIFQKSLKIMAKGATRDYIGIVEQEKLSISLPRNVAEQKKISSFIATWDQAIQLKEKMLEMKKLLKNGVLQHILRYCSDKYKSVEIGKVAEHRNETNTGNLPLPVLSCTKYDGLVSSLEYFQRQVYGNDLENYKIVRQNWFAYATNHIEEGSIGLQRICDAGLVSPMYTVFELKEHMDEEFIYAILKTETYRRRYETMMNASVNRRGSLRWNDFSKIKVPVPDYDVQKRMAQIISTASKEIQLLGQELDQLKQQKKGLMQLLLTGKVRVTG